MSDEQMEKDYRRDQDAIRKYYAAATALQEAINLYPFLRTPDSLLEARDYCKERAEQKQAVWN